MKLVKIENIVISLVKTHGKRSFGLILRILCHSGIIWVQFSVMMDIWFSSWAEFRDWSWSHDWRIRSFVKLFDPIYVMSLFHFRGWKKLGKVRSWKLEQKWFMELMKSEWKVSRMCWFHTMKLCFGYDTPFPSHQFLIPAIFSLIWQHTLLYSLVY